MLLVRVEADRLHVGERLSVSFQRTLRIPDDGRPYPLPPGLGPFPICRIQDHADRVPEAWRKQEGVFIPMYQREALWLGFEAVDWKPNAVRICVGRINAISGEAGEDGLCADPQNYIVCPDQPWLDGINAGDGVIRQFVAMPLGSGYTVEAQVSGEEQFGGLQLMVYEPKTGRFPDTPPQDHERSRNAARLMQIQPSLEMGLGAGGRMRQKVYPDAYGIDVWDRDNFGVVSVHIVNSAAYRRITGALPPQTSVSAKSYTDHGFPWFDLYDEAQADIPAAGQLKKVKSIEDLDTERGGAGRDKDRAIDVPDRQITKLTYDM